MRAPYYSLYKKLFDDAYKMGCTFLAAEKVNTPTYFENDICIIYNCEINGIGAVMMNEIEKLVSNKSKLREWTTTNQTKESAVSSLAMAIANKDIKFNQSDNELYSELGTFIVKYTKTGKMQFEAQSGKHDDRCMSLAIALQAKQDYDTKVTKNFLSVVKL